MQQDDGSGNGARRGLVAGGVVAVVAVIVIVAVLVFGGSDSKAPPSADGASSAAERPAEWPAADKPTGQAVGAYLNGPGGQILAVVDAVDRLVGSEPTIESCGNAGQAIDAASPRDRFLATVAAVPDPVLGDLLAGLATNTSDALVDCTSGRDSAESMNTLKVTLAYVRLRIDELARAAR